MQQFNPSELKKLYIPPPDSHKGQNGKLLIIAGSKLFHAPAIWPAEIASRLVDMVYVSSTPENNKILQQLSQYQSSDQRSKHGTGLRPDVNQVLKEKFWDGIVIRREDLDDYAKEADCILIGPGLPRPEGQQEGDEDSRELVKHVLCDLLPQSKMSHLDNHVVNEVRKNGASQSKKVVIDGGALQVMELEWIPKNAILTPHRGEWKRLIESAMNRTTTSAVQNFAKQHECIVLLKGEEDIVSSPTECKVIKGGNAGMTKGGTGDVLAGLVAALACKNDPFLAACAGSYLNKAAGDSLYKRVGYNFNSSDLVAEIPRVMGRLVAYRDLELNKTSF